MTTESTTSTLEAPASSSESLPTPMTGDEIEQVREAARALVEALQRLANAQMQAVGDLSREVYHNIEQAVQDAQVKTQDGWQSVTQQASGLEEQLTTAAKTAWESLVKAMPSTDGDSPTPADSATVDTTVNPSSQEEP